MNGYTNTTWRNGFIEKPKDAPVCSFSSFDSIAVEQLKLELASARAMETVLRARLDRAQRALDEAND